MFFPLIQFMTFGVCHPENIQGVMFVLIHGINIHPKSPLPGNTMYIVFVGL